MPLQCFSVAMVIISCSYFIARRILSTAQCLAFSDASSSEERNYIPQIKPSASAAAVSAELIADRSDALAGMWYLYDLLHNGLW